MMYSVEISRSNPGCFLFLIDQSGSMGDPFGGNPTLLKSHGVADAVNRLLSNLVIKCSKDDGIRNYFEVGVIGYGNPDVSSAFMGTLAGRELVKIEEIGNNPLRIEERLQQISAADGETVQKSVKFPVWIEPLARNGTPMCKAFDTARSILERWIALNLNSYPPIIINITDGDATDGNPIPYARDLMRLNTNDGNVLLFNIHISNQHSVPIIYPDKAPTISDQYAALLFEISSLLPDTFITAALNDGYAVNQQSRGFGFNADLISLINFIDIGTRVGMLR
ncbi:MAG: VWA domain-containing protein [Nitrospirae bacterium]|nr:VWA domain-containing protein [Nitrospirota bacterium]MBF0535137.1 VWA domain-containing protein [Nitrospirota bacterium]MBF0615244.1 VWA domain-containing protein [Nitrospirota bacterium]